jgi:multiple sugar transport system ATP-binding protein
MNFIAGEAASRFKAATIGVRPEHFEVATKKNGGWAGTVAIAEHLGSDTFVYIDSDIAGRVTARVPGEYGLDTGSKVWLTPMEGRVHRFDAKGQAVKA